MVESSAGGQGGLGEVGRKTTIFSVEAVTVSCVCHYEAERQASVKGAK